MRPGSTLVRVSAVGILLATLAAAFPRYVGVLVPLSPAAANAAARADLLAQSFRGCRSLRRAQCWCRSQEPC